MLKNKIVFFSMGGTILCTQTPQGLKPTLNPEFLIHKALSPDNRQRIQIVEYLKIDSANLNLHDLLTFHRFISHFKIPSEIHSMIVLMGTDNLEHAAFFLSLLKDPLSPSVILTGAISPYGDPKSDALKNIANAYRTATSMPEKKGVVLITFDNKIYGAHGIRKFRTEEADAFISTQPNSKHELMNQMIENKKFFNEKTVILFPKMRTLRVSPGEDPGAVSDAIHAGCQVIIIEGLGNGNIDSQTLNQVDQHKDKAIFIVTSQTLMGNAKPLYESTHRLKKFGVIFAGNLSSGKTLILSSLFLTQPEIENLEMTQKKEKLEKIFSRLSQ